MHRRIWPIFSLFMGGLMAADVNEELLAAARAGDVASMKVLLEKGAPIEGTTAYGQTPLYLAAMNGHEPAVRLLLEKGAKTEVRDTFYKAPMLIFVLQRKHFGVAKALIEKGSGNTDDMLPAVAGTGQAELVQTVLDKGKPSQGALDKTYELALDQKRLEVAELLKKAGAQPPAPPFEVDAQVLASYAGTYKSDQLPLEIKVFVKEGKLGMQATGQPEFVPKAKSATVFEFAPARLVVEFDSPESFTLKQGGNNYKFKKAATQ
jgi:hypothetical protein